jgi:predicted GNAT family acetyltransferase
LLRRRTGGKKVAEEHPLDRPVWKALTTRQARLSIGPEQAKRYRPEINLFAAAADRSAESLVALSALIPQNGEIGTVERESFPDVPGTRVVRQAILNQMVATASPGLADPFAYDVLGPDDAADMLALATLTEPGPFFAETYRMGYFIGVRDGGRLIAMSGQRMRVPGFTEVSAVCTHPDHRGKGLAGKLMRVIIDRIIREGDAAFLHVYPDNRGAIALYEALGFRLRAQLTFTTLTRG